MNNYTVKYFLAGKYGLYYVSEDSIDRARKVFYYTHPSAQIVDIVEG
jgi:hypothetical protein